MQSSAADPPERPAGPPNALRGSLMVAVCTDLRDHDSWQQQEWGAHSKPVHDNPQQHPRERAMSNSTARMLPARMAAARGIYTRPGVLGQRSAQDAE